MGGQPKVPSMQSQQAGQNASNLYTQQMNTINQNANQVGPYGSVTNTPGAKIPMYDANGNITGYGTQWTQTTSLSPAEQKIFDTYTGNQQAIGGIASNQLNSLKDTLSTPFSTAGLPNWETYSAGPDLQYNTQPTDRQSIEDAMMASTMRSVNPQWAAQDAQSAARGMGAPGSQYGYSTQQARGDVMTEAGRQAYLASGAESRAAQQANNQALQQKWLNANAVVDQNNQLRQNEFNENQNVRNQNINEVAAMMGGSAPMVPQGQAYQGSAMQPFDYVGASNQNYQNQMAAYSNKMNGLFGIAGAGLKILNPFGAYGTGGMFGAKA